MKNKNAVKEYPALKKAFDSFYLWLVIFCVGIFLLSLYLAIGVDSRIGIAVGVCDALLYFVLTTSLMQRLLGVGYTPHGAELSVCIKGGKTANCRDLKKYIPKRLLWSDVTAIAGGAKKPDTVTEEIYIYKGLKRIASDAFVGMTGLCRITFEGMAEEWSEIDCEADLSEVEVVFLGDMTGTEQ